MDPSKPTTMIGQAFQEQRDAIQARDERIRALEKALEPFAAVAHEPRFNTWRDDTKLLLYPPHFTKELTLGHCREAAKALLAKRT